jgi:hypothetical protein
MAVIPPTGLYRANRLMLLNASLQYSSDKNGLKVSLMYNVIGARIAFVGGPNYTYPLWEQPHPVLDFK